MKAKVIYQVKSSKVSTKKFECIPVYYYDFNERPEAIKFCEEEVKEGNEVTLNKLVWAKDSTSPTYEFIPLTCMVSRVDGEIDLGIPSNAVIDEVYITNYFDKPLCLFIEYSVYGKGETKIFNVISNAPL